MAEDDETTKSVLKNQIAEQEENFQLILKENEVIKNKLEQKNKRKWKLFCF